MAKRSKKYMQAQEKIQKEFYTLAEACALLPETAVTKFDSTCEIHMNLGIDPKHADQQLRSTVSLPNGTGREVRVVAFVDEANAKIAKAAGAVEAGLDELIEKIEGGWLEFDTAVATPDQMKKLGKIAKILGQKGLMPNPKSGTVTTEVEQTIKEIKKGKVEFRNDKQGNIHNSFGKVSFGSDKLLENAKSFIKAILDHKPAGVKGSYVNSVTLTTTMGPGVKVLVQDALSDL
jgi:large subunit ribosomal protein L1